MAAKQAGARPRDSTPADITWDRLERSAARGDPRRAAHHRSSLLLCRAALRRCPCWIGCRHGRSRRLFLQAKLAEQAERYDEMVSNMRELAKLNLELSVEERNLLSVGYKNMIGARRASWRILSSIESKEATKGVEEHKKVIAEYRATVEKELEETCAEILALLDDNLLPASNSGESKVFYHKMKGDYYRYLAEFQSTEAKQDAADNALLAYKVRSVLSCAPSLLHARAGAPRRRRARDRLAPGCLLLG